VPNIVSLLESLEPRRLFAAGDIDPTFGTGGAIDLPNDPDIVVPLAGEKILSLQSINNTLSRLNTTDFSTDNTFGTQGSITIAPSLIETVNDIIVLKNGKILVGGRRSNSTGVFGVLVRFNDDGQLDTSFGTNGVATFTPASDAPLKNYNIEHLAEQADGKIVFNGFIEGRGQVQRANADGSLDTSFTPFSYDIQSNNIELQLQSGGKIILGGLFRKSVRGPGDQDKFFSLARLNTNGTLDTTFGDGGEPGYVAGRFQVIKGRGTPEARAFLVLADDRILQAGSNGALGTLSRRDASGAIDATFGTNGTTSVDFGLGTTGSGAGFENGEITLTPSGQIVVHSSKMARFSADGIWDQSFGRVIISTTARAILPQANGDLLQINHDHFVNNQFIGQVVRLQGSNGGPAGRISLDNGVVTVVGSDDGESIDANVGTRGDGNDDVISITINSTELGRVYDVADVTNVNISAAGGRDIVFARVGTVIRSSISGGDGNDILTGGTGEESISGNAGKDDISGGGGNDRLAGNGGRDKIQGNDGDDRLFGGASGDWLAGQDGNDQLFGEGGLDRLDGGLGADVLHGNAGDDLITAADGSAAVDSLFGDGGHDTGFADDSDLLTSIEVVSPVPID
jgi:uncharacterized delta-60 repeat protein